MPLTKASLYFLRADELLAGGEFEAARAIAALIAEGSFEEKKQAEALLQKIADAEKGREP